MRRLVIAAAIGALVTAAALAWPRVTAPSLPQIPTSHVQRGRVQVNVYTTGELRASRSAQLFVPPMGGPLQIVTLAQSGDAVKAGDVVVEFDAADQEFALEQAKFDLAQAEQEIVKAEAQDAVQAAEDEVALLHARFDVRRAELDASANELIGALDAQKNLVLLDEARQQASQLEHDVKVHGETSRAANDVLHEKRNKAQLAVQVDERNIDNLRIRAPFEGFVTLRQNMQAFGGIAFPPMPEYRAGDAASPGQSIADVLDTSRVELSAKLLEQDRANVAPGQSVDVAVDAAPDRRLRGTVRAVSSVASRQLFDTAGTRQFDITFDVGSAPGVRPGSTAALTISGPTLDDVLYLPRTAVFDVSGKPTVYVRVGAGFDAHEVRIRTRTDSVAVIEGLQLGTEVALVNPRVPSGSRSRGTSPAVAGQRASR
jgi:multidrug resistance efflux pump